MHKNYILIGGVFFNRDRVTFKEAKKYDKTLTEEEFDFLIKHGMPEKKNVALVVKENEELKEEVKKLKAEIKKLKKSGKKEDKEDTK